MKPMAAIAGALALLTAGSVVPPPAADAAAVVVSSRYTVTLIGLPVGRASFDTTIAGDSYAIKGSLASVGLADIVSKTSGTSSVAGRIRGDKLYASRYALAYSSDKKSFRSDVTFRSGRVEAADVAPKVTKPKKDYVPVAKSHLAAVVDPLSGLLIKSEGTPQSLCNRTIPFFDGWSRLDLVLSPGGTKTFSTDGYDGDVVVCTVRIEPVSGYRASSRGVKFIVKQTIELWFAPIGKTGIHAPVYARIPTEIGPLTLRAAAFAKS